MYNFDETWAGSLPDWGNLLPKFGTPERVRKCRAEGLLHNIVYVNPRLDHPFRSEVTIARRSARLRRSHDFCRCGLSIGIFVKVAGARRSERG